MLLITPMEKKNDKWLKQINTFFSIDLSIKQQNLILIVKPNKKKLIQC